MSVFRVKVYSFVRQWPLHTPPQIILYNVLYLTSTMIKNVTAKANSTVLTSITKG
jgi:hypothetical protein